MIPQSSLHFSYKYFLSALVIFLFTLISLNESNAQPPIDIVFSIDQSGSMKKNDPNDLRLKVVKRFEMRKLDKVGIVSWAGGIENGTMKDSEGKFFMTDNSQAVEKCIDEIRKGGYKDATNIDEGLRGAIEMLNENKQNNSTRVIIFLTDGEGSYTPVNKPSSQVIKAIEQKYVIHTIGLNIPKRSDAEKTLKEMAQETGGMYFVSPTDEFLGSIIDLIRKQAGRPKVLFEKPVAFRLDKGTILKDVPSRVSIYLIDRSGIVVPSHKDININVLIAGGKVEPEDITIAEGESSTIVNVIVSEPGFKEMSVKSDDLPDSKSQPIAVAKNIEDDIGNVRIGINANPLEVPADGETPSTIRVILKNKDGEIIGYSGNDLQIEMSTTIGSLEPSDPIKIKRSTNSSLNSWKRVKLTHKSVGTAQVTAELSDQKKVKTKVSFVFYLSLAVILVALFGGVLGSFVKAARQGICHFSPKKVNGIWQLGLLGDLIIGAILGIAMLFASYIGLKNINIPIVGTANAFLVGFISGYIGPGVIDKFFKQGS